MKKLSLLAFILLAACAANPATGGRNFTLVSANEERRIGESAATYTLHTYGLYRPESHTTKYVDDLCNRVFAVTEAASEPVQCNFIDDGSFNASATPGYMFINRGLLPFMNSEAEFAAVLGHEAGHINARHISRSATKAKVASAAMIVVAGAVAVKSNDPALTNAAIGVGGIGTAVGLAAYSRAYETEADALGRRYMEKLGFDPRESVNMVRAMQMYDNYQQRQATYFNGGESGTGLLDRLKSSHPATPERVAAAVQAMGEPSATDPLHDTTGRQRFMDAIEGLTYGPARRYGIARKGELVLTQQRLAIPLPDAVLTAHTPSGSHDGLGQWLIAHPQSGAYITVNAIKLTAGRSPANVVKAMLPALHDEVTRMEVGTGEKTATAYTATYHFLMNDRRYRILAVPAGSGVDQMLIITAVYPTEDVMNREDAGLFAILKNVTFLTEEQADKYKQLQLHTFRAATGDSVANQAAKLPVTALNEALFRALNNLPEGTDMLPGQLYKTIIDLN